MTYSIPPAHWTQITESAAPYIQDDVILGIVGGSQAAGTALSTSDTDLLIFARHVDRPVSLTFRLDGQKYDVILRDTHSFAYDVAEDIKLGRGTLLHICAFGVPVFDPHGLAAAVQEKAKAIHTAGPAPVIRDDLNDRLDRLHQHLDEACTTPPGTRLIKAFTLAHDLGIAAQRADRIWIGKGKILGRFLHANHPDLEDDLHQGFVDLVLKNDPTIYKRLIASVIPTLHRADGPHLPVPYWVEAQRIDNPVDMPEAFTSVRTHPDLIAPYLHDRDELKHGASKLWLHWKITNLAEAITPERIARPGHEYFYATARYIGFLSTLHSYRADLYQDHLPHAQKIVTLIDDHPDLPRHACSALDGRPADLLALGRVIWDSVVPSNESSPNQHQHTGPHLARLGLRTHRLEQPFF